MKFTKFRIFTRDFKVGIKNLIKWFPIIWKDKDWDSGYMYEMLYHKLNFMHEYFSQSNILEETTNEKIIKELLIAKIYCERIADLKPNYDSYVSSTSTDDIFTDPRQDPSFRELLALKADVKHNDELEQYQLEFFHNFLIKHSKSWWD